MTDVETLAERVRTVERAVTDGDHGFPEADDLAELTERIERVEQQVETIDQRTEELEAATQALRGYVGNVRSVNERVEQRADTALAATERLERRLETVEDDGRSPDGRERTVPSEQATDNEGATGTDRMSASGLSTKRDTSSGSETATDIGSLAADGHASGNGETDQNATDSRDPGVVEQIRSLL